MQIFSFIVEGDDVKRKTFFLRLLKKLLLSLFQ